MKVALHQRKSRARTVAVLFVMPAALLLSISGGASGQTVPQPEYLIPMCVIAGAEANEIARSSTPANTTQLVIRQFGVDEAEWAVLSRECRVLFASIENIAAQARSAQAAATTRHLDAAAVSHYTAQRRNSASTSLRRIQQLVSPPAWTAITKYLSDLAANTQSMRLGQ
ncbi:MAG: hypothetical protein SFV54_10800 [Bryobacteraceae bacterium]|nr:hypothetical protein [Bryobacteraceae bacterium]